MATLSSSGTWTPLPGLRAMDARQNVPSINDIDLETLKGVHGVVHDELRQFCQLAADAYGLKFWQGVSIVETLFKALMNSEGPQQQSTYTP